MSAQPPGHDPRASPSARPHQPVIEDRGRLREVLTYARRGSRFTPSQATAWAAHHEDWVIPDQAVEDPDFSLARSFGRSAPLIVEIGCGVGEATAVLAAARPDHDVLALEVWRPGVAASLARVAEQGARNVRFCSVDAVWALRHLVTRGEVAELWTFFPDPWPKTRHHKRRLVSAGFASLAADRLAGGGRWRLATDWAEYARHMVAVLDAEPMLEGGVVERWSDRPLTKFERKGVEAGREIVDVAYRRF